MVRKQIPNSRGKIINLIEFKSISELVDYIKSNPEITQDFRDNPHSSLMSPRQTTWSGTRTFEDAMEMLENGWAEKAREVEEELKNLKASKQAMTLQRRFVKDVVGFQPIVASWLRGDPESMVNVKMKPMKNKVVHLNMNVSFSCGVSAKQIQDNCINALKVIQMVEKSGCRAEVDVVIVSGTGHDVRTHRSKQLNVFKLRVKGSNERLNTVKMMFPMIHPSFLRRIFFRVVETMPEYEVGYKTGYGYPYNENEIREDIPEAFKGEYLIPLFQKDAPRAKDAMDTLVKL